jgi:hypothetical protein
MIGMAHFKKWEQWSYLVFGESRTSKKGETMRFYRGITVPIRSAPAVIDQIRTRGLLPGDGNWRMSAADLKGRLEEIWRKPKVTYADTKPTEGNPGPSWVCACAEEQGAVYYACRHDKSGENDTPILISFDAEASDAVVDGRDFLYTAFQLSDAARGRTVLEQLFGPAILRYADRAWGVDGDERIALCDLAVQDNAVVLAHADNKTVIAGRFGTLLRSAFLVRTPVPAARIADVRVVEDAYELPEPDIVLGGLIRQGRPDAADAGLSDAGLAPARAYRDTTCGSYRQDRRACVAFSGPFREAVFIFDPCRFPVVGEQGARRVTSFRRSAHWRTNAHGTTFPVRAHNVTRDDWDAGLLPADLRRQDASSLLAQHSVRRASACFVIPNARCPVCSAGVYFYANQFGSRVYFDDLGPPWPKHPCTDNPRQRIEAHREAPGALIPRKLGLRRELIEAANVTGMLRGKAAGARSGREWTLLVITLVDRRGEKNTVEAEYLDSLSHETTEFTCLSSEAVFEVGDLISKKDNQLSFVHKGTLAAVTFVDGGKVSLPKMEAPSTKANQPRVPPTTKSRGRPPVPPAPPNTLARAKPEMTLADRKHFQSKGMTIEQFCASLAPVVKAFAREGTRKPRDVAVRLTYEGRKTACGGKWTPRLVYLLLARIFDNRTNEDRSGRNAGRQETPSPTGGRANQRQPLTTEEIARRKAALKSASRHQNQ